MVKLNIQYQYVLDFSEALVPPPHHIRMPTYVHLSRGSVLSVLLLWEVWGPVP